MNRKTGLGTIAAAMLMTGYAQQSVAQGAQNSMTCALPWCVNYVTVATGAGGAQAANMEWSEIRMWRKYSDGTILWQLFAGPDYEFRANSVVATGTNAAGAPVQFPVRQISPTRFALDDVNTNDMTYTYEVRVYRVGSPPDAAPMTARGTIVNVVN